jgi:glycerol-3-phosphate cytidylyltransferase
MKVGYTTGVFDLFHIGHLNILKNAKAMCDKLIVGCTTDEVVFHKKNKTPIVPFYERVEILESVKYVDLVVTQDLDSYQDKMVAWDNYKFDTIFVGSDWKGTDKWVELEKKLANKKASIIYFPYTKSTSSTKITEVLNKFK